jgi:hypothetical protein
VSVSLDVSVQTIQSEVDLVRAYAEVTDLKLDLSPIDAVLPRFYVEFHNRDHESFYVEFDCADYPLYPPTIEFVNEARSERASKRLYPQGFHPTPCICMRYNRKAYNERGGPHGDWRLLDWRLPTSTGIPIDSLTLMISDLDSKIRNSSGRMG